MQCIAETRAVSQREADRAHSPLIGKVQTNLARHAWVDIGILGRELLGNASLRNRRSPRFPRPLNARSALDDPTVRIRAGHSLCAGYGAADKGST